MSCRRAAQLTGLVIAALVFGEGCIFDFGHKTTGVQAAEASRTATTQEPSLFSPKPIATDPAWGVMVFGGVSAGRTRLVELVPMPWSGDYGDNNFIGVALSRRLIQLRKYWNIEGEVGAGYRFRVVNAPEGWIAAFLRFDGFPWNHWIYTTAAIGAGLSYVAKVSDVELDAGGDRGAPNGSRLLLYLAPEITVAHPNHRDWELVARFHHRSGVFGTFNGVWGGSNVVTGGIRHRF